jgi:hypothetical protein
MARAALAVEVRPVLGEAWAVGEPTLELRRDDETGRLYFVWHLTVLGRGYTSTWPYPHGGDSLRVRTELRVGLDRLMSHLSRARDAFHAHMDGVVRE